MLHSPFGSLECPSDVDKQLMSSSVCVCVCVCKGLAGDCHPAAEHSCPTSTGGHYCPQRKKERKEERERETELIEEKMRLQSCCVTCSNSDNLLHCSQMVLVPQNARNADEFILHAIRRSHWNSVLKGNSTKCFRIPQCFTVVLCFFAS